MIQIIISADEFVIATLACTDQRFFLQNEGYLKNITKENFLIFVDEWQKRAEALSLPFGMQEELYTHFQIS
jgi:hypothetical protein